MSATYLEYNDLKRLPPPKENDLELISKIKTTEIKTVKRNPAGNLWFYRESKLVLWPRPLSHGSRIANYE